MRNLLIVLSAVALYAQNTPPARLRARTGFLCSTARICTAGSRSARKSGRSRTASSGIAVTKDYGYLKTAKNYKDFQLALKFKCNGDGNSGVFFHSEFKPGTADITQGLQFEIDCILGKHTGGIYGDGRQWMCGPLRKTKSWSAAKNGTNIC